MNPWFEKKIAVDDSILFAWCLPLKFITHIKLSMFIFFLRTQSFAWKLKMMMSNRSLKLPLAARIFSFQPINFQSGFYFAMDLVKWSCFWGTGSQLLQSVCFFLQDIYTFPCPFSCYRYGLCVIPFSSQFPQSHPLCQLWNTILTFGKAGTLGAICRLKTGNLRRLEA